MFSELKQTYIIAEAGVNHNGDLDMARALIDAAKAAQADAVKFQLFDPDRLTAHSAPLAAYQAQQADGQSEVRTQNDLLRQLALSTADFVTLQAYCRQVGIQFLCTPFDEDSARFLSTEMQLPLLKISSGEVTNLPFLRMLGRLNTPVILSTGMSTLAEVHAAVSAVWSANHAPLGLLHCVSAYPAPIEAVNLRAMQTLKEAFPDCAIGYSDHTLGLSVPLAAVALGAQIVEKHFTLDKTLPGPDHPASLDVAELHALVAGIRQVERALGDGLKQPHPVEQDCIQVARKSLVAARHLPARHVLGADDLVAKRPGTGVSPADLSWVLGKRLKQAIDQDTVLQADMLDG